MKKSRKYGLIAGGVALGVLAVVAFVFSGYNKERLPTLPTPPGVVVPPGMRYVGGDEFDGPDGTMSDATRWRTGMLGRNIPNVVIDHGCLVLRGNDKNSTQMLTLNQKFHQGRIEVRVKFPQPGQMITAKLALGQSSAPYTDYEIGGISYSDKFGPFESMARRSRNIASVPVEFSTYAMNWDEDFMTVSKNGAQAVQVYYPNENSISELFQKDWKQPWKIVGAWRDDSKGKSDFMKQLEGDLSFFIYYEGASDLEVDYIRIFQE